MVYVRRHSNRHFRIIYHILPIFSEGVWGIWQGRLSCCWYSSLATPLRLIFCGGSRYLEDDCNLPFAWEDRIGGRTWVALVRSSGLGSGWWDCPKQVGYGYSRYFLACVVAARHGLASPTATSPPTRDETAESRMNLIRTVPLGLKSHLPIVAWVFFLFSAQWLD